MVKKISKETQAISFETISRFLKTVPITLFKTGMLYYLIVLCAVFLLVDDGKKLIVGTILMMLVEYFLFYMFNAWKFEWISFIIMLPISLLLLIETSNITINDTKSLLAYIIVLSVVLYSNFSPTMKNSVREEEINELFGQVKPGSVYMVDMVEYLRLGSVYEVYNYVILPNNLYLANGAYKLMDEFSYWTELSAPTKDVTYNWLYNPTNISTEGLFQKSN